MRWPRPWRGEEGDFAPFKGAENEFVGGISVGSDEGFFVNIC